MILSIYSLLNDTPIIENNANIRIATGIPVFAKSDEEVVAWLSLNTTSSAPSPVTWTLFESGVFTTVSFELSSLSTVVFVELSPVSTVVLVVFVLLTVVLVEFVVLTVVFVVLVPFTVVLVEFVVLTVTFEELVVLTVTFEEFVIFTVTLLWFVIFTVPLVPLVTFKVPLVVTFVVFPVVILVEFTLSVLFDELVVLFTVLAFLSVTTDSFPWSGITGVLLSLSLIIASFTASISTAPTVLNESKATY